MKFRRVKVCFFVFFSNKLNRDNLKKAELFMNIEILFFLLLMFFYIFWNRRTKPDTLFFKKILRGAKQIAFFCMKLKIKLFK